MASVRGDNTIEAVAIAKATKIVSVGPNTAAIRGSPPA
jgi:hypothetical protein